MELARRTQNPVSDLISVPFESDFNTGAKNETVCVLNVQSIIPFHLNKDWNLITRTILPIINEPALFSSQGTRSAGGHQSVVLLHAAPVGAFER